MALNEHHTAQDATIKIPNGEEIKVTNFSWSKDTNETEVQHNDSLWAERVTTGMRISGSFEYSGAEDTLRDELYYDNEDGHEGEPRPVTATVKEENVGEEGNSRTLTFNKLKVTGWSRDLTSDDVSSSTWDFVAQKVE